jgi:acyl carrier protein
MKEEEFPMSEQAISQAEIDAVFPKVAQIVSDALGCDLEDVKPTASLIQDLDAESIDFLDLVFRLEKGFGVKIPRGPLPEAEFETKGIVTEAGMARLREFLAEVPADRFKAPMKAGDVPRLFTTETFCKVVIRAQRAATA